MLNRHRVSWPATTTHVILWFWQLPRLRLGIVAVSKGLQMFRVPIRIHILFFVFTPLCATSAVSEGTPGPLRTLIFEPIGYSCPEPPESAHIESFDGLLEDLSLVFSGIRGVAVPGTDLTGPSWKSPQHFERAKEFSRANVVLTIRLHCIDSNEINYQVSAMTLPDGRPIASAGGNSAELRSLRDLLIAEILSILGLGEAIDRIDRTSTTGLDLYLQGNDTTKSLAARAMHLREATALDRDFTPAWTRLGEVELSLGEEGGEGFAEHFDAAEDALKRSLSGSPDSPVAVHALASVFMRTGRTADAIETLRNGLESRPDSALLHAKLGYAFRYAGMLRQSIAEYRVAQKLDSGYDNRVQCERQVVKALIYSGRYSEAADAYRSIRRWLTALGVEPDEKMTFYQGVGRFYAGDVSAAVRFFDTSIARGDGLWSDFAAAYRAAALGEQAELISFTDILEYANVRDGERRYRLVHLNAMAGRTEKALGHLEASAQSGFFSYPYTKDDRLLEHISQTDEFDRILSSIKGRHLALAASSQ